MRQGLIQGLRLCLLALAGWGLSWMGGCQSVPKSEVRPIIADVAGIPVYVDTWRHELVWARSENVGASGPQSLPSSGRRAHARAVLDDLIDRQLLVQQADKQQLTVSRDEIDAAYAHLQTGWQPQAFAALIAHEDMRVAELRSLLREMLLIRKYMRDFVFARLAITDAQIESYAAAHPEALRRPEHIRLAQIVVKTEADVQRVADMIRRGKPFAEVAVAHSQAPQAKYGGDLGLMPRGVLPEAFERVCFSLPVHTLSPAIASAEGYHLFWISEHTMPRDFSLAQMRTEVQSIMRRQAEAEAQALHIAGLRRVAHITIKEAYLVDAKD